jgi:hypothetical protein
METLITILTVIKYILYFNIFLALCFMVQYLRSDDEKAIDFRNLYKKLFSLITYMKIFVRIKNLLDKIKDKERMLYRKALLEVKRDQHEKYQRKKARMILDELEV